MKDNELKVLTDQGLDRAEAVALVDGGKLVENDKQAAALAKIDRQVRLPRVQLQVSGKWVTQNVRGRLVQDDTGALTGELEVRDPETGFWTRHGKGTWRYAK